MKSRNWIIGMGLLVLGIALGAGVVWWLQLPAAVPGAHSAAAPASMPKQRHILYWAAPMDPKIHSDHPMKDSMGMAYIPVYASSPNAKKESGLSIDPRLAQNLGVRLVAVQHRQMGHAIHTVGTVAVDENRVYSVTPRFSGWVTRLNVRAVGGGGRFGHCFSMDGGSGRFRIWAICARLLACSACNLVMSLAKLSRASWARSTSACDP